MFSKRLTASAVKRALSIHSDKVQYYRDGEGLQLRTKDGRAYWIHTYEHKGRRFNLSLGPAKRVSLAEARRLHSVQRSQLLNGANPKTVQTDSKTVADVTAEYLADRQDNITPATHAQRKSYCVTYLKPIARLDVTEVTTQDLALILRGLKSKPQSWQFMRRQMRALFRYARRQGYIATDPGDALESDSRFESKPRNTTLDDGQICALWASEGVNADILRLCLLTGARVSEIANARWGEYDQDTGWLVLTDHKTARTTDEPRRIYFAQLAREILAKQKRIGDVMFPSPSSANKPRGYNGLRDAAQRIGGGAWQTHDLRRTMRTRLSALGVNPFVAEHCLGHKLKGVMGHYDHHYPRAEVKEAIDQWNFAVSCITSDTRHGKVLQFPS